MINRRNVKGDPSAAYRAQRDFLTLVVKSRVIAAAGAVLAFKSKTSNPVNFPLPDNIENKTNLKAQKLEYLHIAASKIVDSFAFDYTALNNAVDKLITAQARQDIMDQQELTPDGRFSCRCPNCSRSFKYDGKSRRRHELSHDPPLDIPNNLPGDDRVESEAISSESDGGNKYTSTSEKDRDDIYNYSCALLEDGLFFINFLDAVSEGAAINETIQIFHVNV